MTYRTPTFNLTCAIWFTGDMINPPDLSGVKCQLYYPRQVVMNIYDTNPLVYQSAVFIRMPRGTDIRWQPGQNPAPVIEAPEGSLKRYQVRQVEDCNCGFPNEYRVALCVASGPWPAPIPPGPEPAADLADGVIEGLGKILDPGDTPLPRLLEPG